MIPVGRGQFKCVGTRAETRFRLSAKRTSPFKSAGRQFSRLLAAEVCTSAFIVGSNAGYTMFRGSVKSTGYPLHSRVFPSRASPCAITFQLEPKTKNHSGDDGSVVRRLAVTLVSQQGGPPFLVCHSWCIPVKSVWG